MKQQEAEQGQQQREEDRERDFPSPLLEDTASPPASTSFGLPAAGIPQSSTDPASHREKKLEDDSELEDSDEDEDGGVALFGPGLGGLSLWDVDVEMEGGERDDEDDGLD